MRNLFVLLSAFMLFHWAQGHSYDYSLVNGTIEISDADNSVLNTKEFDIAGGFEKQANLKSSIGITSPTTGTVWTIPDSAELEWNTMNIGTSKSIRFFLAKDDMVVQELGTFPNTGKANDIVLAKNIGSGDNYQVVGIELFPDDKFQIAKFATPYFSIRNKISDARKQRAKLMNATKTVETAENVERKEEKAPNRTAFNGRNISYVKELKFDSEEIRVNIWDHGRQDGDIVSIYLNGLTVISKHLLTYHKRLIKIKLDPTKKNDLFLYAHNLGEFAPNTVSVEISDGKTSENIILNSDLKSCEAVLISVKK